MVPSNTLAMIYVTFAVDQWPSILILKAKKNWGEGKFFCRFQVNLHNLHFCEHSLVVRCNLDSGTGEEGSLLPGDNLSCFSSV